MIVEQRPELASFIHTWTDKPKAQVVEELASYGLETHRIPDPYHFLVSAEGDLFSPVALCRVKDVVQRTSHLGQLEYQAVATIEQWTNTHQEGVIVWISPPYAGVYPTSKIIISEIEQTEGVKRLFNRAIVLDFDERQCFNLAQNLARFSLNRPLVSSLNEIRAHPLILNTQNKSWIDILEIVIKDANLWVCVRQGEDRAAKKEALVQARIIHHRLFDKNLPPEDARGLIMGVLGEKSSSCPILFKQGTAFQLFAESAIVAGGSSSFVKDQYGSLEFPCPHPDCRKINRRPYGQLIPVCQHCSKDVRC